MSKKKVLPKELPKDFVADAKVLDERLREQGFREAVESLLRTIYDNKLEIKFFDGRLRSVCGLPAARAIGYMLHQNDVSLIDKLRGSEVPKETLDFLAEIVRKFGLTFDGYKLAALYPNDWKAFSWDYGYDLGRKDAVFKVTVLKQNREVVVFEGTVGSFFEFASIILERTVSIYNIARKDMPKIKPKFTKTDIDKIQKHLQKIRQFCV